MFNWLFGKKEEVNGADKVKSMLNARDAARDVARREEEAKHARRVQHAMDYYGSKRSYTFPDGKEVVWEVRVNDWEVTRHITTRAVFEEVVNGAVWRGLLMLKDLTELSPPAKQLFLVLVKDQRNIKLREVRDGDIHCNEYIHAKLGISVKTRYYADTGYSYAWSATGIDIESANQVMRLYEVYTKVFNLESRAGRYKRVKAIRDKELQTRKLNAYLKTLPE